MHADILGALQSIDTPVTASAGADPAAHLPSGALRGMLRSRSDTTEQSRDGLHSFSPQKSIMGFDCAACSACQSLEAHLGGLQIRSATSLPAEIEAELLPIRRAKLHGLPPLQPVKGSDAHDNRIWVPGDGLKPS